VNTIRIGTDAQLVFARAAHVITVLIIELYAVKTDVEKVTVSRVKVDFEHETYRESDWFVFLEEVHLIGLAVKTSADGNDLFIGPSAHERELDRLADIRDPVHRAWSHTQSDAFLRSDQRIIEPNDDLADTAERVFCLLVVIVKLKAANRATLTKIDSDCVVFSGVKRNKPHVPIIVSVVIAIE